MEECIQFRTSDGLSKVRVFLMSLGNHHSSSKIMNHYTAGIYHSNWLVQNLANGSNNLSTIRLFRLAREWKDLKSFYFLPCEILDLVLSYATFSFKENGVFKVLLKFFTLLSLMLCQHNSSFYEISDYHSFMINQITPDNRNKIIEAAQKTFTNLSVNNTSDFAASSSNSFALNAIFNN